VVDDGQCIGELLSELLIEAGYRVQVAHDGNDAFAIAQQDKPALVLSDIMTPSYAGANLARRMRRAPQTRAVPVALMSSARPKLNGLEGIPFLPKPCDNDDVLTVLQRHARTARFPHGKGLAPPSPLPIHGWGGVIYDENGGRST
jgi:CheY-like chemotaxis protein